MRLIGVLGLELGEFILHVDVIRASLEDGGQISSCRPELLPNLLLDSTDRGGCGRLGCLGGGGGGGASSFR